VAVNTKTLQTVVGFFQWLSRPLLILRPFLAAARSLLVIAEDTKKPVRPSRRLSLGFATAKEILENLPPDFAFALHRGHTEAAVPHAVLSADASGLRDNGAGAVLIHGGGRRVSLFSHRWLPAEFAAAMRTQTVSSTYLELLALLLALRFYSFTLGPKFQSLLIDVEMDSADAVSILHAGYARDNSSNDTVRKLFVLLGARNLAIRPRQILRDGNQVADALSKQSLEVRKRSKREKQAVCES
jgi:hypothetical protein